MVQYHRILKAISSKLCESWNVHSKTCGFEDQWLGDIVRIVESLLVNK